MSGCVLKLTDNNVSVLYNALRNKYVFGKW